MSTVIQNNETQDEAFSSDSIAPKTILKSTYVSVINALQEGSKLILITGAPHKGKTSLLHTINKDIATKNRIILLSGKDLPTLDASKNNGNTELNTMKDFILESTDLEDKLVVILDDAHCLPISFLTGLVEGIKNSALKTKNLQLILSGPLNFKDQLLAIEQINTEDLIHCTIDNLSHEEIDAYIKSKTYKISSGIKRINFDKDSLSAIAEFIQSDQQVLDVILEWCAAIVKKDQLSSMSSQTVNRATSFAQQFSKDKNIRLSSAYPPSHEVYKYINDIQSSEKPSRNTVTRVAKKSVKKINTSKTASQKTKIPTISAIAEIKTTDKQHKKLSSGIEHEDEVMPANWTPSSKPKRNHKKSISATAVLTILVILGFITFIALQIGPDPKVDDQPKQIVSKDKLNETTADNEAVINEAPLKAETSANNTEKVIANPAVQNTPEPTLSVEMSTKSKNAGITEKINIEPSESGPLVINNVENEYRATEINDKKSADISLKAENKPNEESDQIKLSDEKLEAEEQLLKTELSELLVLAKFQYENKQLSTPTGDNALETYQKILAKHPNHKEAIEGIKNVHDKYLGWANYYLKQNDLARAKNFYNKALGIDPSNAYAIKNLQAIAQQEAVAITTLNNETTTVKLDSQQSNQPRAVQNLLATANKKMEQINSDIRTNNRNYKTYQEAQNTYQTILRSAPQNQQALKGLSDIKAYYTDWAELQVQSKNYNIALFLYGQALSIEPENAQINQRIEQIRDLKKAL